MRCPEFDAGTCRSCTWMGRPYDEQLAAKQAVAEAALPGVTWSRPVANAERGYRNRAKLVVGGTVDAPTLGILDAHRHGVDLDCGLYEPVLAAAVEPLRRFVTGARLVPYDVPTRAGELKYLLVTVSPAGELMVRFVLRSTEALARIRKHLPTLALPGLVVASVNVQPAHAAVLEGDQEILLTEAGALDMPVGDVTLRLPPRSFFQTSSHVAGELYRQAAAWADELAPRTVWDLYCGVGGFALHLAAPGREVVGVELSGPAVDAARAAAGDRAVTVVVGDSLAYARTAGAPPDLVVVNPPRRGVGPQLAAWLDGSGARVLYSSCHLPSLVDDLVAMPRLRAVRGRVLDMFPQTAHAEVLVELVPRAGHAAGDDLP